MASARPDCSPASNNATRCTLKTASARGTESGRTARASAVALVTSGTRTIQRSDAGTGSETVAMRPSPSAQDTVRPP